MSIRNTVLIVDDSRVSRLMTRQFILNKHPDWNIVEVGTGEEALEKLKELPGALVVLDVNMPGMGGIAAAEQMRAQYPAIKIAIQTANIQDSTRAKAEAMGVGFIEKPISEARIHKLLDEWVTG